MRPVIIRSRVADKAFDRAFCRALIVLGVLFALAQSCDREATDVGDTPGAVKAAVGHAAGQP